jgi:hypothetical protein
MAIRAEKVAFLYNVLWGTGTSRRSLLLRDESLRIYVCLEAEIGTLTSVLGALSIPWLLFYIWEVLDLGRSTFPCP